MRRGIVVALVTLTLQVAAWADGIDIINKVGTISISTAGITSKGSQIRQFNLLGSGQSLGSVFFSTGALVSGSIQAGGIFSSVGSVFQVIGMGNGGQPKGVIFNGAFVGPITWTLVSQNGSRLIFQLVGDLSGQLFNGTTVTGTTTQIFRTTPAQLAKGIVHITSGHTQLAAAPEPGTLGMLGIGLLGIARMARRKLLSRG